MKSGFTAGGNVVARSLKITRATHVLVAALMAAVCTNVMVAMQFVGLGGQAALVVLIFATVALATSAVSADLFSRSGQAVANLRSIGASMRSLSTAVLTAVLVWGVIGASVGTGLGLAMGLLLGGTSAGSSIFLDGGVVICASAAAIAAGVYAGAKMSWHS